MATKKRSKASSKARAKAARAKARAKERHLQSEVKRLKKLLVKERAAAIRRATAIAKKANQDALKIVRSEMRQLVRDIGADREAAFRSIQGMTSWQFAMYADELADMFDVDVGELYDYYYYGDAA